MARTLQSEFPDYPADTLPVIEGFEFEPWHNDACPRFVRRFDDGCELSVFVDYLNPDMRECAGDRFTMTIGDSDGFMLECFTAETLGELLAKVGHHVFKESQQKINSVLSD